MHPKKTDRLRTFLAKTGFLTLFLLFLCLYAGVAVLGALAGWALGYVEPGPHGIMLAMVDGARIMLGFESGGGRSLSGDAAEITYGVFGAVIPGLFFGVVVFKYFMPKIKVVRWRQQLDLVETPEGEALSPLFYIATDLDVFNLEWQVVLRCYEMRHESGDGGRYPMKSFYLTPSPAALPMPFAFVPTTFQIPVTLQDPDTRRPGDTVAARAGVPVLSIDDSGCVTGLVFDAPDQEDVVDVSWERGDWAELHVLISADLPEIGGRMLETCRFELGPHIKLRDRPRPLTVFRPDKRLFEIRRSEWRKF